MFGFFRKKHSNPDARELERLSASALNDVKEKWKQFVGMMHFKEEVPLSQQIDLFAQPAHEFFQNTYPSLLAHSTEIFWLTLFTAILESGTNSKEEQWSS